MITVDFELRNDLQKGGYSSNFRHIALSGGYGNGKTTAFSMRGIAHAARFNRSRGVIGRYRSTDLQKTTMVTFYKICPPALYAENKGGKRVDSRGYLRFINGSEIYFMHFDEYDEGTVRGLEINWCALDQAEEISENVYLHLDSRVGRWDGAEVPIELLEQYSNWPKHPASLKPIIPSWMIVACNPDTYYHWIYKRYHPESEDHLKLYKDNHIMFQAGSDPALLDPEVYREMLSRDPVWIARFVRGEWGITEGLIHRVPDECIIKIQTEEDQIWLRNWIRKAALYRILDHGDSAPTCVLWCAVFGGFHIFYREYYLSNALISDHRQNIEDLSQNEHYVGNYADPSIFHKVSQKQGGRFSVADEYLDKTTTDSDTVGWQPADNNEFATRNRINEFLRIDRNLIHPFTKQQGSPRLFFVERSSLIQDGCYNTIKQMKAQKRAKIGDDNGRPIFSDDRDDTIPDHAYDCVRYEVSIHLSGNIEAKKRASADSFLEIRRRAIEVNRRLRAFG